MKKLSYSADHPLMFPMLAAGQLCLLFCRSTTPTVAIKLSTCSGALRPRVGSWRIIGIAAFPSGYDIARRWTCRVTHCA
jgi:hypothetical protein